MKTLNCIICKKELDEAFHDESNQPVEGTTFISHGHYGSIFDPMNNDEYLEINICNGCLLKNAEFVYHCTEKTEKKIKYVTLKDSKDFI